MLELCKLSRPIKALVHLATGNFCLASKAPCATLLSPLSPFVPLLLVFGIYLLQDCSKPACPLQFSSLHPIKLTSFNSSLGLYFHIQSMYVLVKQSVSHHFLSYPFVDLNIEQTSLPPFLLVTLSQNKYRQCFFPLDIKPVSPKMDMTSVSLL